AATVAELETYHNANPLVGGMNKEELLGRLGAAPEVFAALLQELSHSVALDVNGDLVRLAGRGVQLQDSEAAAKQTIETAFLEAGLKVPALKEVLGQLPLEPSRSTKLVTLLLRDRVLVKLGDDLVFHRDSLAGLRQALAEYRTRTSKDQIDVAGFKDLTGVSRKYAIPLLEHL